MKVNTTYAAPERPSLEDVTSRTSLVALVGRNVALRKEGREFVGLCLIHGERTPSLKVREDKGFFHCFGCGVHGDCFDYLQLAYGKCLPHGIIGRPPRAGFRWSPVVLRRGVSRTGRGVTSNGAKKKDPTGAEHARRYRERRRRGVCTVSVEVACEMGEALIMHGDLDDGVASDHNEIAKSIAAAACRALQIELDGRKHRG